MTRFYITLLSSCLFLLSSKLTGHPTGNMIKVGEHLLWSYINPIDDLNHYACVMIWSETEEAKVFIQSAHPASDYMLYNNSQNEIYLIERRHLESSQDFEIRILKTRLDRKPQVIWDWFKDDWRIGEGGFFMPSEQEIIFCKYPAVYSLKKGEKPVKYFEFDQAVKRLRLVEDEHILLLADEACYLVRQDGSILKQWKNLINKEVENAPLNRNQIFDADYQNDQLLLAYWGNRSFEMLDKSGRQYTLLKQKEPLTPHWVAFWGNKMLLFSSELIFGRVPPKPLLTLYKDPNNKKVIWQNLE